MSEPHNAVTPAHTSLAERYGRRSSGGRRWVTLAVAAVAIIAGVAWVVWAGLGQAQADVRWTDIGFVIHGNTSVDVTYDVGKDPSATAVCSLRALDRNKTAVGIAHVTVGPASQKVTRRTDTVRTSAQAVSAMVRECTVSP